MSQVAGTAAVAYIALCTMDASFNGRRAINLGHFAIVCVQCFINGVTVQRNLPTANCAPESALIDIRLVYFVVTSNKHKYSRFVYKLE